MDNKMVTKKAPNVVDKIVCELCDFKCCKTSDYERHCLTRKHIIARNGNKITPKSAEKFICDCGKIYKHLSGLSRHKRCCKIIENSQDVSSNAEDNLNYKDMFLMMMKKNEELQTTLLEVLPKIGNTTNHNTNCNNKFNLHVYLNETCKDAMNIMDFVNSLNIQLSEVETFGSSGYVEGISKIFIRGLKELEATKRPIHCSDLKRETLYVKDNNTWEKENAERSRIKEAIKKIANKNVRRITDWTRANPTSLNDYNSKKHSQYMYILNKSMGACDPEENDKDYNKIIRRIANHVTIEREIIQEL
jgi:hypothetical protein